MGKKDDGVIDPCYAFWEAVRNTNRFSKEDKDWLLGLFYAVDCKVKSLQTQNSDIRQKLLNKRGKLFPQYEVNALRISAKLLTEIANVAEKTHNDEP